MMIGAALLRYGDASNFEISDSLLRPTPSSNQVLVNIHSSSVNPIDIMKREGYGKTVFEKQRRSNFPWVLGSDFSGTISEVGSKVTKFKEGDEVWGCTADANHGTYAEYGVFDLEEIEHKPVNLSFNEAASLPYVALTTWAGVIRWAGLRPQDIANKKVLIQAGSGGVGTFAIQLFKLWGAEVATTCSKKNHELVKKLGADVVIDYTNEDFVEVLNDYDIVLDSVGDLAGETEIERCSKILKQNNNSHYITLNHAFARTIDEKGFLLGVPHALFLRQKLKNRYKPVNVHWSIFRPSLSALQELTKLVSEGDVIPVIDRTYKLTDIKQAHDYVATGHAVGKVVIEIQ